MTKTSIALQLGVESRSRSMYTTIRHIETGCQCKPVTTITRALVRIPDMTPVVYVSYNYSMVDNQQLTSCARLFLWEQWKHSILSVKLLLCPLFKP